METANTNSIAFCGDLYLGEREVSLSDPMEILMQSFAACSVNLEAPILQKEGLCTSKINCPLYSNPYTIETLNQLQCNLVSLGNNHIADWGQAGLCESIERLKEAEISFVGAGLDLASSRTPFVAILPQGTVGFLSYGDPEIECKSATEDGYGCNPLNPDRMREEVAVLAREVDVVIAQVHTGLTNYHLPLPGTRTLFRQLIDAGASAVIGHHPHVIQGREIYRSKPIYYSLGNFVFAPILRQHGWMNLTEENCKSIIVELRLANGQLVSWKEHHTAYCLSKDILNLIQGHALQDRTRKLDAWSVSLSEDLPRYSKVYQQYVMKRTLSRLLWRLHPLRWNEISLKHFTALVKGFTRS